jgi:hypothetical protein
MKKRYIFIIILAILALPLLYFRNEIKFLSSIATSKLTSPKNDSEETPINPLDKYIEEEPNSTQNTDPSNIEPSEPQNTDSIGKNNVQNKISKANSAKNKKSLDEIINVYNPKFKALENEFNSSLDKLISDALSDYNSGNYTKYQLARFYLDKGYKIEKESDAKFYSLVKALEKELKENSLDLSLKDEIAKYYESVKSTKKDNLINKGMALVNGN